MGLKSKKQVATEEVIDVFVNKKDGDLIALLEDLIPSLEHLRPKKKIVREALINSKGNKKHREKLFEELSILENLLEKSIDNKSFNHNTQNEIIINDQAYNENALDVLKGTRDLERSYTSLSYFYRNIEEENIENLSILNASIDQLRDLDNSIFISHVRDEINNNYDRLDLKDNYSLLVIPGYLKRNSVIEVWSKIAFNNKVLLITDFEDLDSADDIVEFFESADHTGSEVHKSNTIMTCNWLVGRGKYSNYGEDNDLLIPPSTALAGKIYSSLVSQASGGKKYGIISWVRGVSCYLKKMDLAELESLGLIPMIFENGQVMAYSSKTLFNGNNLGLQTYSVVRVFDFIAKVLMDYLNQRTFENFNSKTRQEIVGEIVYFLDSKTGAGNLIESFSIKKFEPDPKQKDKIQVQIHLEPYFPAKNFILNMDSSIGDTGNLWKASYMQE